MRFVRRKMHYWLQLEMETRKSDFAFNDSLRNKNLMYLFLCCRKCTVVCDFDGIFFENILNDYNNCELNLIFNANQTQNSAET